MKSTFWTLLVVVAILSALAWRKDPALVLDGSKDGLKLLLSILPILVLAFVLAGLLPRLVPAELLVRWLGQESGLRGVLIGSLAGAVAPAGPFVYPLLAGLLKAGVGVGVGVAFLSSWALLDLNRIFIYEAPILGWRFACIRVAAALVFPPLIGLTAQALWNRVVQ